MLLPKRIWKDIQGCEGKYQVSNNGKVRSLNYRHTGKTKILQQIPREDGYIDIGLFINGKVKNFLMHRLVALAFIPNPNNYKEVDHINHNRSDNRVENLRWVTSKQNMNDGIVNRNIGKSNTGKIRSEETKRKLSEAQKGKHSKPILMFTKEGEFIRRFDSAKDASDYLHKKTQDNITSCARGEAKTAYGYIWKYEQN